MIFGGDPNDLAIATSLLAQGWLPCWGQSVAISTYPDLNKSIGSAYGGGSGGANIMLPDLRGRFIRGAHNKPGATIAFSVGEVLRSLTAMPLTNSFSLDTAGEHIHGVPHVPSGYNSSAKCAGNDNALWNDGSVPTSLDGAHTHTVVTGGDEESRPVNLYVEHIIKVLDVQSAVA